MQAYSPLSSITQVAPWRQGCFSEHTDRSETANTVNASPHSYHLASLFNLYFFLNNDREFLLSLIIVFCTFVTEASPPAHLTVALPGLLTGAMATAGLWDAAFALLTLPSWVTPVNAHRTCDLCMFSWAQVSSISSATVQHPSLTCKLLNRHSDCWCHYSCMRRLWRARTRGWAPLQR